MSKIKIVVRACGERTEQKCIELAKRQGQVKIIRAVPFGESIRKTYLYGLTLTQKWLPVIDADVLLFDNTIKKAIAQLNAIKTKEIFCLDGKTKDKIMLQKRRAGIHIYRTVLLKKALKFIDNNHIKPESHIRRSMSKLGYPTYTGKIIFGLHDYEQYYFDLWRKAICQTQKLAGKIRRKKGLKIQWNRLKRIDKDYLVIMKAHLYGKKFCKKITIDRRIDFDAEKHIKRLGISEKGCFI